MTAPVTCEASVIDAYGRHVHRCGERAAWKLTSRMSELVVRVCASHKVATYKRAAFKTPERIAEGFKHAPSA